MQSCCRFNGGTSWPSSFAAAHGSNNTLSAICAIACASKGHDRFVTVSYSTMFPNWQLPSTKQEMKDVGICEPAARECPMTPEKHQGYVIKAAISVLPRLHSPPNYMPPVRRTGRRLHAYLYPASTILTIRLTYAGPSQGRVSHSPFPVLLVLEHLFLRGAHTAVVPSRARPYSKFYFSVGNRVSIYFTAVATTCGTYSDNSLYG
jgi:hypothetical protein